MLVYTNIVFSFLTTEHYMQEYINQLIALAGAAVTKGFL